MRIISLLFVMTIGPVLLGANLSKFNYLSMGAWDEKEDKPFAFEFTGKGIGIAVIEGPNFNLSHPVFCNSSIELTDFGGDNSATYDSTRSLQYHANHVTALLAGKLDVPFSDLDTEDIFLLKRDNNKLYQAFNGFCDTRAYYYQGFAHNAQVYAYARKLEETKQDEAVLLKIFEDIETKTNIKLINLSFTISVSKKIIASLNRLSERGVIFVHAVGNDGVNLDENLYKIHKFYKIHEAIIYTEGTRREDFSPTFWARHIFVGALSPYESQGQIAFEKWPSSSYYTDSVDNNNLIMAPGAGILSAAQEGYVMRSGSSMAAPLVSGALAIALEQNPNQDLDKLITRLRKQRHDFVFDEGTVSVPVLNVKELLASEQIESPPISPLLLDCQPICAPDIEEVVGEKSEFMSAVDEPQCISNRQQREDEILNYLKNSLMAAAFLKMILAETHLTDKTTRGPIQQKTKRAVTPRNLSLDSSLEEALGLKIMVTVDESSGRFQVDTNLGTIPMLKGFQRDPAHESTLQTNWSAIIANVPLYQFDENHYASADKQFMEELKPRVGVQFHFRRHLKRPNESRGFRNYDTSYGWQNTSQIKHDNSVAQNIEKNFSNDERTLAITNRIHGHWECLTLTVNNIPLVLPLCFLNPGALDEEGQYSFALAAIAAEAKTARMLKDMRDSLTHFSQINDAKASRLYLEQTECFFNFDLLLQAFSWENFIPHLQNPLDFDETQEDHRFFYRCVKKTWDEAVALLSLMGKAHVEEWYALQAERDRLSEIAISQ
jgi:hypothetical protein